MNAAAATSASVGNTTTTISSQHYKRPREDDVLEVFLYPRFCHSLSPDEVSEPMLMQEILKYQHDIAPYIRDYLWHRDELTFVAKTKQAMQLESVIEGSCRSSDLEILPHIHILLRFDEDIGDEWFIVFLILNLTRKYDGLIARMVDSDGEFLLIEAADEIPNWATPESCQNRVFVMDGAVHIVQDKQRVFVNSLNSIYQRPHLYRLADKVQAVIHKRISIYPEEIKRRMHKARAYLPLKAAHILKREPGLVSSAIRSMCHSDPLERKVCRAMRYFPPEQRVMANVSMSKCLYAMATHCRYTGDPRTGWNLPPVGSPKYNACLLGIKIACGLEMMMSKAHETQRKREKISNDGKFIGLQEHDEPLQAFLRRLEATGYFRRLLEGSQEREQLLEKAKMYYMEFVRTNRICTRLENREDEKLLELYKNILSNDVDKEVEEPCTLSPEDSDSWLNIDPSEFEEMLNQQFGVITKASEERDMQSKVKTFITRKSGIEGVQFFGEKDTEPPNVDSEESNRVDFDAEVFDTALRDILDFVVPGDDDEFDGSSEGSLGGDDEDPSGEMDKYMKLLDSQLQQQMVGASGVGNNTRELTENEIEENFKASIQEEAGGSGPLSNIFGGPIEKLKHLKLKSDAGSNEGEK
ncbi:hypothetical protein QAD02_020003 [Eretmocerus hayati]|uniref:Uncharacterized protein n=1 Tax=Eretmocerus hayati TaxID=131215 RepID=A0ACC2PMF6_9HYME|nr:hypothetical protein QAD02_020003 [Eretmocerus hayati]